MNNLDPRVRLLFDAASGLLEYLSDEGHDVIDSGIIMCFALVLHKARYNSKLTNAAFLKLIQKNLEGALKDSKLLVRS